MRLEGPHPVEARAAVHAFKILSYAGPDETIYWPITVPEPYQASDDVPVGCFGPNEDHFGATSIGDPRRLF